MAPLTDIDLLALRKRFPTPIPELSTRTSPPTRASLSTEGGFLEAWAQGYNVGSLIILILIVFCNYRSGIWLHKLILLELVLALWHGTFIFVKDPDYGWYLSATAALLFISYFLHNVVSWIKIRPFLPRWGSRLFIISLLCVQPFWVVEAWSNFAYFNSLGSEANVKIRPWEALLRDPWWIFTTWELINAIKKTYAFKIWDLVRINTRFGIMLLCMIISIAFLLVDVVVSAAKLSANSGINPYWRFALVFKCASDTIFLDDFKSVLDDIVARKLSSKNTAGRHGSVGGSGGSGQKLARSVSRGAELIECTALEQPTLTPVHTTSSSQATAPKSKFALPFSKERKISTPKINVQQDMAVASHARQPSHNSWESDNPILPKPARTVHGNIHLRASESEQDLMIKRIV
ncbi:uncharacterized protein K460DRAFT_385730 [Cucurbitaria berberidis CBS 394.84]|uniref:Uncharacterized protein n=1 Tax=Cucurbitaria berberidis CBS 394.84 TaxID=1168544 RepID=A0A9P4L8A1_9PLEO|nr:uncharacterized protein K460DRAFT_385730 [Cucurbitaria berberidis CBS 394.84]KAF1845122.1 hypothetical protein K460DRAFT_385730 [Cucurbitaria berberidis CBS 394.84]